MKRHVAHTVMAAEPLTAPIPKEQLQTEVGEWARRIGVQPEIHVRALRTKWASCSTRGRLTFDTGLLRQPGQVRIEVIVHELLHLDLADHGPLFRARLKAYLSKTRGGIRRS